MGPTPGRPGPPRRLTVANDAAPDADSADHEAYFVNRDPAVRQRLLERYEPLATRIAGRFSRSAQDREVLRQVAMLGILEAIDRFDPGRGVRFTTFAWATASGELKRHRRDTQWSLHLPRAVQECYLHVAAAADDLPSEIGREATVADLVDRTGRPEREVRECLALRGSKPLSLEAARSDEDPRTSVGGPDRQLDRIDEHDALARALGHLSPGDRQIIIMRYVEGLTQDQIAKQIGGSQMKVSRALARGIDRLRALLAQRPAAPA